MTERKDNSDAYERIQEGFKKGGMVDPNFKGAFPGGPSLMHPEVARRVFGKDQPDHIEPDEIGRKLAKFLRKQAEKEAQESDGTNVVE